MPEQVQRGKKPSPVEVNHCLDMLYRAGSLYCKIAKLHAMLRVETIILMFAQWLSHKHMNRVLGHHMCPWCQGACRTSCAGQHISNVECRMQVAAECLTQRHVILGFNMYKCCSDNPVLSNYPLSMLMYCLTLHAECMTNV